MVLSFIKYTKTIRKQHIHSLNNNCHYWASGKLHKNFAKKTGYLAG